MWKLFKNVKNLVKNVPCSSFILSLYGRESIVFESNFETEILMDLQVMSPQSKNHTFSGCTMSMCKSACVYVIRITQKKKF